MNTASTQELLPQILEELQAATEWLRVLAEPVLRERLKRELRDQADVAVYQASTGRSIRDIEKETGVSKSKVAVMWNRWASAGIVRPTGVSGRYMRIADLQSIGVDIDDE